MQQVKAIGRGSLASFGTVVEPGVGVLRFLIIFLFMPLEGNPRIHLGEIPERSWSLEICAVGKEFGITEGQFQLSLATGNEFGIADE